MIETAPYITRPDEAILVTPALWPAVEHYAAIAPYGTIIIDDMRRYDRRAKYNHRYSVSDTHGVVSLTVPVASAQTRPQRPQTWHDIPLSAHGRWWHTHRLTIESAYGRTPFMQFYIDRLSRFFDAETPERFPSVAMLCREADLAARTILGMQNRVIYTGDTKGLNLDNVVRLDDIIDRVEVAPYYQVRADKHGFTPHLSVLDIIFNRGPEALPHLALNTHIAP